MEDEPTGAHEFDLRAYILVLRRRRLFLAATVVALVALAAGLSLLEKPTYAASASVLIPQDVRNSVDPSAPQSFTSTQLLDRQLQNEILFAQGNSVQSDVQRQLGRVPKVQIAPVPDADALTFRATDSSAEQAAKDANTYASAYLSQRRTSQADDYLSTGSILQKQINQLKARKQTLQPTDPSVPGIQAALVNLQSSLSDLRASGQLSRAGGDLVNRAKLSSTPVSPNVLRNCLIGAFLGLVLGIWLVFLRDRLDDSVESKDDLESVTSGLVTLAVIPWTREWRHSGESYVVSLERPASASSEAYRGLRTTVQLVGLDDRISVIAAVSAGVAEGKTTTVVNLGVALSRTGQRVAILDADFRRPRVHDFFGLGNELGLTGVLTGETSLDDALREVGEDGNLAIVPAGPPVGNPSELLASSSVQRIIDALRARFAFVLIDCPPVLPVPDAVQIAHLADGVLLVAGSGRVNKRQLRRALELLSQTGAPLFGAVLNGVPRRVEESYGYYGDGGYTTDQTNRGRKSPNGGEPPAEVRAQDGGGSG